MAVRCTGVPRNVPNGVAGLGADGRALPSNLPIQRGAVFLAASPVLFAAGGSLPAFMTSIPSIDDSTNVWVAANVQGHAPPGGVLATLLFAYLVGLGQTPAQASVSLATIYSNASSIAP